MRRRYFRNRDWRRASRALALWLAVAAFVTAMIFALVLAGTAAPGTTLRWAGFSILPLAGTVLIMVAARLQAGIDRRMPDEAYGVFQSGRHIS